MPDLPIVPCYQSENCGKTYQCGTSRCKPTDPICYQNIGSQGTIPAGFSGECWGWDTNTCDGILSCCDPNVSNFSCKSGVVDPALSIRNQTLGCKIGNSSGEQTGDCAPIPNQKNDICMEFLRQIDNVTDVCQENCWSYGGKALTNDDCSKLFQTKRECDAMPYFCSWNNESNTCTAVTDDPYDNFKNKFNVPPPLNPVSYDVVKSCTDLGLVHGLNCIESPNFVLNNITAKVSCSQSAWDSKKNTSYDPRTRICCLETCSGNNCNKKCLATNRCQYVPKTTDCGIKNGKFMCGDVFFRNVSSDGTGGKVVQGSGYCTWCQNQSKRPQEVPPEKPQGYAQREPTEWVDLPGGNRCSNYNQCEYNQSEELWNQCIFGKLPDMAVDPKTLQGLGPEEKTKILRESGFCLASDAPENVMQAVRECEKELRYMGSISGEKSISPGGASTVDQCSYSYAWIHKCEPSMINVPQISENYLCTWCPSLICKQGSSDDICSNINSIGTCTTNDTFGDMVNPEKWQADCGCFSEKNDVVLTPDVKAGIIGGVVGGGTVIGLIALLAMEFAG